MKFLVNMIVLITNMLVSLAITVFKVLVSPQAKRTLWYFIEMLIYLKSFVVMLSIKGYQLLRRGS